MSWTIPGYDAWKLACPYDEREQAECPRCGAALEVDGCPKCEDEAADVAAELEQALELWQARASQQATIRTSTILTADRLPF